MDRRHRFLSTVLALAVLAGCGSSPQPARSAQEEIGKAERFIASAKEFDKKNEVDVALDQYKLAKESIGKGTSFAEGNELARLRYMEEEIRGAVTSLEMRKLTQAAKPEKPKAEAPLAKTEDPEEQARKEAAEAKKKKETADAKANAVIDDIAKSVAAPPPSAKKTAKETAAPGSGAEAKREDTKAGDKAAAAEDAGPPAIQKAEGPYTALTDKSPPVQVCKLQTKGNFALVYFQIFNNSETGKRIMNAVVFFKDVNNKPLIAPQAAAVFPYSKDFKADTADPFHQEKVTALTLGSAQVTGFEGLRLVGVGESERAKDVKSVAVKVIYADGKDDVATGLAADAPGEVPGLKALEGKK